jgi:hypothetical protein
MIVSDATQILADAASDAKAVSAKCFNKIITALLY